MLTLAAVPTSTALRVHHVPSAAEIRALLRVCVRAPSGDNVQPWRVAVIEGPRPRVLLEIDERLTRQGAFGGFSALLSLGALAESVRLESASRGFGTTLVWDQSHDGPSIRIDFVDEALCSPTLAALLPSRKTTRGRYRMAPVFGAEAALLEGESTRGASVRVHRARAEIEAVASASALAERVRFDDTDPGDLMPWLRFTAAHATASRDGLDVRLLALQPHERLALRLSGAGLALWCMRRLGMGRIAARRFRNEIRGSGGVGAIVIEGRSSESFVEAGRVMLRAWLRATALGLSFAPVTVGACLPLSRHFGATFSRRSHRLLDEAEASLRRSFAVGEESSVAFLFRVGVPVTTPVIVSERRALSSFSREPS